MTARTALALINHVLDEVLLEKEGDFDSDSRFRVKWLFRAVAGKAHLIHPEDLSAGWNPVTNSGWNCDRKPHAGSGR